MSDLEKVLEDVGNVCKEAAKRRETWRREGKYYNVFNALGIQKKELIHSAFIADLLNPKGDHGAGDEFLKAFLKCVPAKKSISEDYLNVNSQSFRLSKERPIEHGRIDIIAEDGENAIIIENKIDAGDQETQLLRYYNYAKEREEKETLRDHKLIYLTKNGHEPSEASTGGNEEVESDCICMSYKDDIIPWLTECANIASKHNPTLARVGETIKQYIYLIKQLTYSTMDNKELEKVTEISIKGGNLAATAAILQARDKIRDALITRYIFEPLKEKFKGFKCEIDTVSRQIKLSKDGWENGCIQIKTDKSRPPVWEGMYIRVEGKPEARQKLSCFEKGPNKYGSTYGYESIPWDWEPPASYVAIRNGKIAEWLIEKINAILKELEKNKIEL